LADSPRRAVAVSANQHLRAGFDFSLPGGLGSFRVKKISSAMYTKSGGHKTSRTGSHLPMRLFYDMEP